MPLDQIRIPMWLQQCWPWQANNRPLLPASQTSAESWEQVSLNPRLPSSSPDVVPTALKLVLVPIDGDNLKARSSTWIDSTTPTNLDIVNATSAMAKAVNRRSQMAKSIAQSLHGNLVQSGHVTEARVRGTSRVFMVQAVHSAGNVLLEEAARVDLDTTMIEVQSPRVTSEDHSHINGMQQADDLCKFIVDSFQHVEAYTHLNIPNNRAAIITGAAGSGKYTVASLACQKANVRIQELSLAKALTEREILESDQAAALSHIRIVFDRALQSAPCAVLIRDMDVLAKDRGIEGQLQNTVVSIICKELERIRLVRDMVVIALSRNRNNLPEAFKRTELFQHEVQIPIPIRTQREEVLKAYMSFDSEPERDMLLRVAQMTSGYVAKDLRNLCRSAKLHALRRSPTKSAAAAAADELKSEATGQSPAVAWEDYEYALSVSRPSQQVEFDSMVRRHDWNAVGGYEDVKKRLYQAVHWPITHPDTFKRMGVKPPTGLLLYGPSGCGKTMLVQALATTSNLNFIPIKGPEIYSKYLGETEATLRRLFAMARQIAPCILFFDEMDAIGAKRGWSGGDESGGASNGIQERVLSTLLNEMDGVEERTGVFVIGCTNQPQAMDDALLRPGRLDQLIYVGYPGRRSRRGVIDAIAQKIPLQAQEDEQRDELAQLTVGFSPADLSALFREAATRTLRQDMEAQTVGTDVVKEVIRTMAPTVHTRVKTAFHRLSEPKDADPDMDVLVPDLFTRFQQERVQ
ncbi:Cell division control protein 48 B [Actinomortierella ambigua]|nr:Cell division control protein 48 B [Actinomortierella ambigua]